MKSVDKRINDALNSCKKDINLEKHKAYVEENYKIKKRFSTMKLALALSGSLCVFLISVFAIILAIVVRPAMSTDSNYVGLDSLTAVTDYFKTYYQEFTDYREFEFNIESKNLYLTSENKPVFEKIVYESDNKITLYTVTHNYKSKSIEGLGVFVNLEKQFAISNSLVYYRYIEEKFYFSIETEALKYYLIIETENETLALEYVKEFLK